MAASYRFAEIGDADALGEVHTRSWQVAYAGLVDQDQLDQLDPEEQANHFRDMLTHRQRSPDQVTWIVAQIDDRVIGHTIVQLQHPREQGDTAQGDTSQGAPRLGGRGHMNALCLHPDHWGTGIGSVLHDMGLRSLRRRGYDRATVRLLEGDTRALDFYERHGWIMTGNRFPKEWSGIEVVDLEMDRSLDIDLLVENRSYWNAQAPSYAERQSWSDDIEWGIFGVTDADAGNIFPDVDGLDVVELGCGTAYVSNWAIQRGARTVIGLDNSPAQLATAQARAAEHQVALPLLMGDAQRLPFADNSFDVAINEYGAAIWCDPRIWILEAARVLRPGGLIWFLGNSVQLMLCAPEFEYELAAPDMLRPQRDMHRFEWLDTNSIDFHVSHGEMIAILTGAGFQIQALHELYAPPQATTSYGLADATWAGQWPIEEVWVARLR